MHTILLAIKKGRQGDGEAKTKYACSQPVFVLGTPVVGGRYHLYRIQVYNLNTILLETSTYTLSSPMLDDVRILLA